MNRSLLLLVAFLAFGLVQAQDPIFLQRADSTALTDSARFMVTLDGQYNFDSNTLYNDLTYGLRYARTISREVRDRSRDALKSNNRVGDEIHVGLTYWHFSDSLFGSGRLGWQIGMSYNEVLGVKFTEDLYKLTFYGNKDYEDKTAYLDGSNQFEAKYQKLGFGVFDKHSLSYARLSMVVGQRYTHNELKRGSIYTAPEGVYLDLDYNGVFESSDSVNTSLGSFSGIGAALDFEWNVPLDMFGRGNDFSQLSLAVHDLGFVSWNGKSHRARADTVVRFEGLTVDDLFNLEEVVIGEDALLDSIGVRTRSGVLTRMLPINIRLSLRSRFDEKWFGELGLRYRDVRAFVPHAWFNLSFLPREQFRITLLTAYGGFGGFRVGLGTEIMFAERWYVGISSSNLIGSISEDARGQQVSLRLSTLF